MSRADDTWAGSGSPFGLSKWECVIPSCCALRFIISAKRAWLPPIFSATAIAMSLAEWTAMPCSAFSTVIVWPACMPRLVRGWAAACGDTVIRSVGLSRAAAISSNARYRVMTFEIEAG
jgi:hypothetical protein